MTLGKLAQAGLPKLSNYVMLDKSKTNNLFKQQTTMNKIKRTLTALASAVILAPALVACGAEKPVEVTSPFGQKMEVLCEAKEACILPGQGAEAYATEFQTTDEFVATVRREEKGNPFAVGMARGFWDGAINSACN